MSFPSRRVKYVLDLAKVTTYLETDGTFNIKIKLVINITPQISQHLIVKVNTGWLIIISLNLTCSRHNIPEVLRFCVKQQSLTHSFLPREGVVMVVIVWYLDLQLHIQSVHIITEVLSSNPTQDDVHSMQYYLITFVRNLRQVVVFSG